LNLHRPRLLALQERDSLSVDELHHLVLQERGSLSIDAQKGICLYRSYYLRLFREFSDHFKKEVQLYFEISNFQT